MKNGDDVGEMPMKLAAEGASGGALARASRGDLSQGFSRLDDAGTPDPFDFVDDAAGELHEGPQNEIFTERDAGGFLKRPHGLER